MLYTLYGYSLYYTCIISYITYYSYAVYPIWLQFIFQQSELQSVNCVVKEAEPSLITMFKNGKTSCDIYACTCKLLKRHNLCYL